MTTNDIFYTNLDRENNYEIINIVDHKKNNVITQKIEFNKNINLKELTLKFYNSNYSRTNFSTIKISICNVEKKKCIFETEIGGSKIQNDELTTINLNNTM